MGFLSVLSFAHKIVSERIQPGDVAVDATIGTGADTLFLAKSVGPKGLVFGFDIQEEALSLTQQRLHQHTATSISPVTLLLRSHASMREALPLHYHGKLAAIMFNLGYLPATDSNKEIITETDSTITALETALELLRPGGVLTAVLYPGHPGGDLEAVSVRQWASTIPQSVAQSIIYQQLQRADAPYTIAVEKK
ncbi:tRNA (mnm(5)s(2)U34)-methyltransferase [Paenibacillus crassostreae]|uniref:SAM-dependent methyltransferase n=1 Tax=Paenibacillus crassostreae TaxID=1763538 RepID=A0A167GHD3_9BACL|nr:class I SAM-dependent methyltransferase [Paenibacillus crassostreae]AOZ92115.1 SAM-dependent methyltransferase [Paenibacillus crassostreae]OAB77576.1 SAM-dependent methyltransferase [Paenibacillus crassostreae]